MGYYSGNGITTGGGKTTSVFFHFAFQGAHNVWQKSATETLRKCGVSLQTAQAADCANTMSTKHLYNAARTVHIYAANCSGTKKDVTYSQIGESNLYELQETTTVCKARLDDGEWQ